MASNTFYEEEKCSQSAAASGKETLEYRKVLAYLGIIVKALKANKEAKSSLCLNCKEKKWIETTQDPEPGDLMGIILNRIELDAATYYEFMTMLGNIIGLDLVKRDIEEATSEYSNSSIRELHLINYL